MPLPDLGNPDDLARVVAVGCLAVYFKAIRPRGVSVAIGKDELEDFHVAFLHLMRIFVQKYLVFQGDQLCSSMAVFRHAVFKFGQAIINCSVHRESQLPPNDSTHEAYAHRSEQHLMPIRVYNTVKDALISFWPHGDFPEFVKPDPIHAAIPMQIVDLGNYRIEDGYGRATGDLPITEFDLQKYRVLFESADVHM